MDMGYACVSTDDQYPDLQMQALQQAGCTTIYTDTIGGTVHTRPQLEQCLKVLNTVLCSWPRNWTGWGSYCRIWLAFWT